MKARLVLFENEIVISLKLRQPVITEDQNFKIKFESEETLNELLKSRLPIIILNDIRVTELKKKLIDFLEKQSLLSKTNTADAQNTYCLTQREKEILKLMVKGLTKRQMAQTMSLSFHTIDSHIRNVYKKLGVKSKIQAIIKSINEDLTS